MKFEVLVKERTGITIAIMDLVDIHTWKEACFNLETDESSTKHYVIYRFKNTLDDRYIKFKVLTEREFDDGDIIDLWDEMKKFEFNPDASTTVKIDQEWVEEAVGRQEKRKED